MLSVFLKNVVAKFKEPSDMLQNTCAEISWFSWLFSPICSASGPNCAL